jgi:anti-sigma regulatory factor (Ser/Thr protein kinase)
MKKTRKFAGNLECLGDVCDFVTDCAKQCELNEAQVYAVQLAVDEAATNIIEHAYKGRKPEDFEITCEELPEGFQVVLRDRGKSFDPDSIPEPLLNVPLEELRSRGLGVFLIRKMMDEVDYEFDPQEGNTLRMVKKKKKSG